MVASEDSRSLRIVNFVVNSVQVCAKLHTLKTSSRPAEMGYRTNDSVGSVDDMHLQVALSFSE